MSNKKKMIILGIFLSILIVVAGFWSSKEDLNEQLLFENSLTNLKQSQNYIYDIKVAQNDQNFISNVEGKRIEPDRVSVKGELFEGQNTELFQISDKTFMKDPFSKEWITFEGTDISKTELFFMELNPLVFFEIKEGALVDFIREEELGGIDLVVVELHPQVENVLLDGQNLDYQYLLWISIEEEIIKKASIRATRSGGEEAFNVEINFKAFNQEFSIEEPA